MTESKSFAHLVLRGALVSAGAEVPDMILLPNGVGLERVTGPQVRFNRRPSVGIVTLT